MTTPNLAVSAVISGALPDLVIDGANSAVYELHAETAGEQSVSWRKQEAANEWVEGSFTVQAVRENVIENLSVWVLGNTTAELEVNLSELLLRLEQLSYTVALTIDGVTQTWKCFPADYSITSQREFKHARTTLVAAKVPRLPKKVIG